MKKPDPVDGFLASLQRIVLEEVADVPGVTPELAADLARRVADGVCLEWARREVYIPADYDPRNRDIMAKIGVPSVTARAWSPARVNEVAAEFGLTARWVYKLAQRAREADMQARQGVLDGFTAGPNAAA